jgi:N-acetyl-gamma-glutamyl-phosphate reductase / acetylglutamate kinase
MYVIFSLFVYVASIWKLYGIAFVTILRQKLLELYGRALIRSSKRISNPGCYATSSQLLIAPLVNHIKPGTLPTVFGISGYSGGGTIISKDASGTAVSLPKISGESLEGGVKPYALTGHIHEREAGYHLSRLLTTGGDGESTIKVAFIPSVAPWFSGIISTVSIPLSNKLTAKDVIEMFEEKYAGERLVKIRKEVPELKDVKENHGWVVGGFQTSVEGDRVVIVVCCSSHCEDEGCSLI